MKEINDFVTLLASIKINIWLKQNIMKINLPEAVDLFFLADSETKKFILKFKDNDKRWKGYEY